MGLAVPNIRLSNDQPLPGLDDRTPTPQQLSRGRTKKMNCEVGGEYRLLGADKSGGGSTSSVVGEGRDYPGVDVSVLLPEPRDDNQLGFDPVGTHSDQGDTQVGDKRRIGQDLLDLCLRPARGRLLVGAGPFLFGRWA